MHEHNHKTETSNYTLLYTNNYIGNEKIDEVATHKVLGVTIDNLSWTNHVNELTKCISKKTTPTLIMYNPQAAQLE